MSMLKGNNNLWQNPMYMTTEQSVYLSGSSEQPLEKPQDTDTLIGDLYKVVLFNDDYHTFDEVINQIMRATGCGRSKAELHTWEVHNKGKSIVYDGELMPCIRVSSILEEIQLKTEIQTS
jgi:ATP-dependent Clp protease adaptor protein ClpS